MVFSIGCKRYFLNSINLMFGRIFKLYLFNKLFGGRRRTRGQSVIGCGCLGFVLLVVLMLVLLRGCGEMVGGGYNNW